MISMFKTYSVMVRSLAMADFRMRDQGTMLGFLWTMLNPLLYFVVLYGLFNKWMSNSIPHYSIYLIIGIVQWGFFSGATTAAIMSIPRYAAYVRSIGFPRITLVAATVLSVTYSHIIELSTLIVFWVIVDGLPSWHIFGILFLLAITLYLIFSISLVLAVLGVFFLDILRIWGIVTSVGMFVTPIFYSVDMLSPGKQFLIWLNPMSHIITATRALLIDHVLPDAGGLAYVIALATGIGVCGLLLFRRCEGYFIEKL